MRARSFSHHKSQALVAALFVLAIGAGCQPNDPPPPVGDYPIVLAHGFLGVRMSTNLLDPTDFVFNTASLFYGLFEDNDGLVTVCSSQFGEVIGDDYLMNHLDEVNQIAGLVSLLDTNPKTLFRNHVGRLLDLEP